MSAAMEGSGDSSVERRLSSTQNLDDPLMMQTSDNPGMVLVTVLLNDSNFLTWSRSVKRALTAKNKLGFVTGCVAEPSDESEWGKWRRVDEMVTSWIINSMTKDIAEIFVYCSSSRKLWLGLEEKFGESSGPQIYQIHRQIASIEQGNQSIVMYYNRLKKLWEELNVLQPMPYCTCGTMNGCECNISGKFSSIILVLDPLPAVSKAYSMVLGIEKQRAVQNGLIGNTNASVMAVKSTQNSNPRGNNNKRNQRKEGRTCEHCKATGHLKESC